MKIQFPKLQPWQDDVWRDLKDAKGTGRTFVVKAKRQIGKSLLSQVALIYYALTYAGCDSAVLEPTLNQSRRMHSQIVSMLQGTGLIKSSNSVLLSIEFFNGSRIQMFSSEQKDGIRGFTVSGLLIIDEAAFTSDESIQLALPFVDANSAPVLMVSTPMFKDGMFYTYYMDGQQENPFIRSYDWSQYDTSIFLSPERLEFYRKQLTPQKFRTDYLGLFLEEGSLLFGDNIRKCIRTSSKAPIYGGIDWGTGTDSDNTVLTLMDEDRCVTRQLVLNRLSPSEQVSRLCAEINASGIRQVQVETNSIGTVYLDYLRKGLRKDVTVTEFSTSNESKRRIIEELIKAFEQATIGIPDDRLLVSELQHYAMERTPSGKVTYNGQGAHDDTVMALAFVYDLAVGKNKGVYAVSTGVRRKKMSLRDKFGG